MGMNHDSPVFVPAGQTYVDQKVSMCWPGCRASEAGTGALKLTQAELEDEDLQVTEVHAAGGAPTCCVERMRDWCRGASRAYHLYMN
jgi:hypothetical protein